jgi:hypothetical protein
LIHKVIRPLQLVSVGAAKSPENDPGSSQGSGVAYEGPPQGNQGGSNGHPEADDPRNQGKESSPPNLSIVVAVEQIGMTDVVREFHENKKESEPRAGLTSRYMEVSGNAKGLLLNKKVE